MTVVGLEIGLDPVSEAGVEVVGGVGVICQRCEEDVIRTRDVARAEGEKERGRG